MGIDIFPASVVVKIFFLSSTSDENLQKAFKLSDRVSERERYLIQGYFYSTSEKTYDKAIEHYEKFLSLEGR